jgi:hypothetical protein
MTLYPGPCVICGGRDYALSMGGPTICPPCDAGHYTAATVMNQAQAIKKLHELLAQVMDSRAPDYAEVAHPGWNERARAILPSHAPAPEVRSE